MLWTCRQKGPLTIALPGLLSPHLHQPHSKYLSKKLSPLLLSDPLGLGPVWHLHPPPGPEPQASSYPGLTSFSVPPSIQEAESHPQCRRLQLRDLIISEMQRLTKYPLLLENIIKHTEGRAQLRPCF